MKLIKYAKTDLLIKHLFVECLRNFQTIKKILMKEDYVIILNIIDE